MTLIDLLRSPWAIVPDRLDEIQAIYSTHLRGEKIDVEAIEARLGRPLANDQQEYRVEEGGVAVLELSGAISPKANLFTRVSGGASAQVFERQVQSMRADSRVRAVVLDVDSPGGNVLGLPSAAEAVRALAGEKPCVTVCSGIMASGGYWIGSASNSVYISGLTDMVGSIGVVAKHTFDPRASAGRQTTEVTAGKYKRIASDSAPLTAEGRAYMQAQVDEIYRVFVDTVAKNRRVSAEQVLEHMADGRVFVGQQAVDAGLVDGVATVDQMVERMATDPQKFASRRKAVFALGGLPAAGAAASEDNPQAQDVPVPPVASETNPVEVNMTPQELAAKFATENPEAAALLRKEGATAELGRIKDVRAAALPGHEALIEQLAMDGKTSGAEAALAVVAAERAKSAAAATARAADAVAPVAAAAADAGAAAAAPSKVAKTYRAGDTVLQVDADSAALDAKAKAYQAAHPGTDYLAAVRAVQQEA